MYIRMSQNCDRVVVLKSVSLAIAAFDANGDPLKGVRKSTTVQIASFDLLSPSPTRKFRQNKLSSSNPGDPFRFHASTKHSLTLPQLANWAAHRS